LLPASQQQIERLGEPAEEVEGVGEPESEGGQLTLPLLGGQALRLAERLPEHGGGLDVRIGPRRPLRHAHEIRDGLRGPLGPREVMREPVRDLLEPARVQPLERLARRGVELAPAPRQEALVRHLAGEGVLEEVHGLLEPAVPMEELEPRQLAQLRLERARPRPDRPEEIERHLAAQHRRRLERPLPFLR
jgi:hypothetical protein